MLADLRYSTVAEDYRSGKGRLYSAGRERTRRKDDAMGRGELLRWIQLIVCASIFLALVVAKINMPARFESLRAAFSAQMEHSVDYREVFSAVGRAVSGEESLQKVAGDVYAEVFHPAEVEGQAVETTVTVPLSDISQQEPVNALLAFSRHWDDCGTWLQRQGERSSRQELVAEKGAETAESAPPPGAASSSETQPEEAQVQTAPAEEVPEGVIMEQCVLGISYTTPVSGWLSSPFGYREHPIEGEEKFHRGLDIAAPAGTDIGAFADGTVKAVGESSSLGKYIMLSHSGGLTTIYGHCSKITASGGAVVKKGEKIAEVGSTGLATGAHLHFAMQQKDVYLNPIYYVTLEEAPSD